jgi:nucleoside-diphosphate-sugar epimerase
MAHTRQKAIRVTHLFCFGLGYSSGFVAERLAQAGWRITGTSTRAEGAAHITARGYTGLVFDGTAANADVVAELKTATHVLLSIPPGADGDPAFAHHANSIRESSSIAWIGYFSTVGVYGDAQGGWVDEDTDANPGSERGKRRLAAEQQWLGLARDADKHAAVFRLPGIYGPGRCALDDVLDGTARSIIKPGQVFNRIHAEDIASAVIAAMDRPHSGRDHTGRIYNVTDDEPGPPQDVVNFAAELLGHTQPPSSDFATADLSPMSRSFYSENKRVSNARMKAELGIRLKYPNYREGLTAILRTTAPKIPE